MADPLELLGRALARSVPGGPANPESGKARADETLRLLKGQVVSVEAGTNTCTVTTDGTNPRSGVPSLYAPSVADVVWVVEQPPHLLVLGTWAAF